jgi:hypothetical protein
MNKRIFVLVGVLMGLLVAAIAAGQTNKTAQVPKTPWGDPDLQGPWTSDDTWGVPFERPASFGTRAFLTEDELKAREKQVEASKQRIEHPNDDQHSPAKRQLDAETSGTTPAPAPAGRGGGRGGGRGPSVDAAPVPGQFGEYARRASKQTSQIIDPPNGRIPELTPEGKAKQEAQRAARGKPLETWTDWSIYDRCITRGVAGSIIPVIYGNGLEIVQAPGYVAIRYEMVHDTRIIPLDGRPHLSKDVHTYMGDPVGHFEGNTLVVETTNLNDKMGVGPNGGGLPYSEDTKLIERFTRMPGNVINYELTVDDPRTYTAPWKVAFPITQEPGYKVFEYACHEGNMSLRNAFLARRAEKQKAEAGQK